MTMLYQNLCYKGRVIKDLHCMCTYIIIGEAVFEN